MKIPRQENGSNCIQKPSSWAGYILGLRRFTMLNCPVYSPSAINGKKYKKADDLSPTIFVVNLIMVWSIAIQCFPWSPQRSSRTESTMRNSTHEFLFASCPFGIPRGQALRIPNLKCLQGRNRSETNRRNRSTWSTVPFLKSSTFPRFHHFSFAPFLFSLLNSVSHHPFPFPIPLPRRGRALWLERGIQPEGLNPSANHKGDGEFIVYSIFCTIFNLLLLYVLRNGTISG